MQETKLFLLLEQWVFQRACILSEKDEILEDDLFLEARSKKEIKNLEKELIFEVLKEYNQDTKEAAKALDMDEKKLKEKIKKYNL